MQRRNQVLPGRHVPVGKVEILVGKCRLLDGRFLHDFVRVGVVELFAILVHGRCPRGIETLVTITRHRRSSVRTRRDWTRRPRIFGAFVLPFRPAFASATPTTPAPTPTTLGFVIVRRRRGSDGHLGITRRDDVKFLRLQVLLVNELVFHIRRHFDDGRFEKRRWRWSGWRRGRNGRCGFGRGLRISRNSEQCCQLGPTIFLLFLVVHAWLLAFRVFRSYEPLGVCFAPLHAARKTMWKSFDREHDRLTRDELSLFFTRLQLAGAVGPANFDR